MQPMVFVVSISILLASLSASAEIYELYRGARGLGMGGADTAVVNDETALLVNPAGLGKLRNSIGTLIDPEVELNEKFYNMYKAKAFSNFTDLSKLQTTLDVSRNKHFHYKYQLFPSFVIKNFGMGFLVKESMDAKMSEDGSTITANYFYDWVLATGFNFRFWDGRIKLGVTAKAINRVQASGDFPTAQSLKIEDIGKEGYGLGSDVGLILSAPWGWLPTLSVVGRDIGGTKFTNTGLRYKLATKPADLTQDADVAIAFFPINSNYTRSSFTFEHKHVLTASQYTSKTQLYHFGWETNFSDVAFLRLGMNGPYYTVGVEIASERVQMQLAYYGENAGTDTTPIEDRRWAAKFVFRY
jgi:hypothetical protein